MAFKGLEVIGGPVRAGLRGAEVVINGFFDTKRATGNAAASLAVEHDAELLGQAVAERIGAMCPQVIIDLRSPARTADVPTEPGIAVLPKTAV